MTPTRANIVGPPCSTTSISASIAACHYEPKDKPTRTDQARQVAEEYADDQREIIKKLRKPLN